MVKIPGGFLENTHTTTNIQPQFTGRGLGDANSSEFSTGGPKVDSQPHSEFQSKHCEFSSIEKPSIIPLLLSNRKFRIEQIQLQAVIRKNFIKDMGGVI